MKPEERIVERYLEQQGWRAVTFQPDGSVPPDFSLCGQIAVEVMRLSRWVDSSKSTEESASIPLSKMIQDVLKTFDKCYAGSTYVVALEYKSFSLSDLTRSEKKGLRQQIESGFVQFLRSRSTLPYPVEISNEGKGVSFSLTILAERTPIQGRTFRLGIERDRDMPVPDVILYAENIRRCIATKGRKITPYRNKYPVWQLILVDSLGGGLDSSEAAQVRAAIPNLRGFDSVLVINHEGALIWSSDVLGKCVSSQPPTAP